MKIAKRLMILSALVGLVVLSSCTRERVIIPSKKIVTDQVFVEDFDELSVGSAFTCYVDFENKEELVLEVNENLMEYVDVRVVNGELRIELEDRVNLRKGAELTAYVGAKFLKSLSASGASRIYLRDDMTTTNLTLRVSGASRIKGRVTADYANAEVSGASDLDMKGYIEDLDVDGSGASNITGYELETENLDLELSGASRAELSNDGEMKLRLSGASIFRYQGDGVITSIETSGASKVERTK